MEYHQTEPNTTDLFFNSHLNDISIIATPIDIMVFYRSVSATDRPGHTAHRWHFCIAVDLWYFGSSIFLLLGLQT
ncbi:hypothetical protein B0H16DRAFT_1883681 [Mycena metata]|uniref:Uncharacterized protein n=1 Tax=Mycena metata TaxID=1033252 RepID=A0AAD7NJL7_9AGAR|nr:hypothetical protein B0H16DRAFT_1883681 [Mycena metata]